MTIFDNLVIDYLRVDQKEVFLTYQFL